MKRICVEIFHTIDLLLTSFETMMLRLNEKVL